MRIKATIGGHTYWQMREISAQNAATGQNSLRAHFGLGDATMVDSLRIEWPSGVVDMYADIDVGQFLLATEGERIRALPVSNEQGSVLPEDVKLYTNYPNPFNPTTMLRLELPAMAEVDLDVVDLLGRTVATLFKAEMRGAGMHEVPFESCRIIVWRIHSPAAGRLYGTNPEDDPATLRCGPALLLL